MNLQVFDRSAAPKCVLLIVSVEIQFCKKLCTIYVLLLTIVDTWLLSASNHVIPAFLSERFAPILGDQEYFWRAVSVMGVKMSILKQIPSSGIPRPQVEQC